MVQLMENQAWSMHTNGVFSVTERNEALTYTAMWANRENTKSDTKCHVV